MKALLAIALIIISTTAFALELRPYTKHKITVEQWNQYHTTIVDEIGNTRKENPVENTEVFTKDLGTELIVITFTNEEHQAHPSWVTEVMKIANNQLHTQVIGYYVRDVELFTPFYEQIKSKTDDMKYNLTP